jgi:thioredoxin-related protein
MQSVKWIFLFGLVLVVSMAYKPDTATEHTKWISLKDAADSLKKEKRPVLIDLYTDWCGWCKVMDKKTYSNKNVSAYLAKKFYAVKIDAEGKKDIQWNGKNYNFNAAYKTHNFAIYLTNGQLSYPTTVIIPADGSAPQAIPGYLEPKDFELIVKYFGEDKFGKIAFEDYRKSFKPAW